LSDLAHYGKKKKIKLQKIGKSNISSIYRISIILVRKMKTKTTTFVVQAPYVYSNQNQFKADTSEYKTNEYWNKISEIIVPENKEEILWTGYLPTIALINSHVEKLKLHGIDSFTSVSVVQ